MQVTKRVKRTSLLVIRLEFLVTDILNYSPFINRMVTDNLLFYAIYGGRDCEKVFEIRV